MAAQENRGRAFWQGQLADWAASGAGLREFAAERGLNRGTLAWWRWRIRQDEAVGEARPVRLLPVEVRATTGPSAVEWGAIEVRLPDGVVIRVEGGLEAHGLGAVVRAVVEATRC